MTHAFLVYRDNDGMNTWTLCDGMNPAFAKKALKPYSSDKKALELCSSLVEILENGSLSLEGVSGCPSFRIGDPVFGEFDFDEVKDALRKKMGGADVIFVWVEATSQWIYADMRKSGWFNLMTNAKIQAKAKSKPQGMLTALQKANASLGK